MTCSPRTKLRLLVVEDEALIALELESLLEDLGHTVVEVGGTLERALDLVEALGSGIDAAVLDANLAGKSAAPVAKALEARGVPFVVASGYEAEELRQFGFEGPSLRKPYRGEEIARALARLPRPGP
jgi:CheY-like chemotaxis protein